jgi:hypothetical protein
MKIKSRCTTERILDNTTLFRREEFSSLFFHNYGNGNVTILDNIVVEPCQSFVWENQPVNGNIILIDDDIPVSFAREANKPNVELIRNLLVMKVFYSEEK